METTTSGLAMFCGDRTNSATSGQDRSSPSRPKHQKHAVHASDLRSEAGQATATTATSPYSSPPGIAAESGASRDTETVLYVRSNTAGLQRDCYGQNADAHIVNDFDDDDVLILTPCDSGIDVWLSARKRSINDEDDAGSM